MATSRKRPKASVSSSWPDLGKTGWAVVAVLVVLCGLVVLGGELAGEQGTPAAPPQKKNAQPAPQPCPFPRCPHCGAPLQAADCQPTGQPAPSKAILSDPVRFFCSLETAIEGPPPEIEQVRPLAAVQVGGPVSPDGRAVVTCDLPLELRTRNVGGSDGAGLCVFSSIGHQARYNNEPGLKNFQTWMRDKRGGGWPNKVDDMIRSCSPQSRYIQYEGSSIDVARQALSSGRMPSITWGGNHMLNLVHHDGEWCCALDNNFVGENELRWLKPSELLRLYNQGGGGWTVVLLAPRPPSPPCNVKGW